MKAHPKGSDSFRPKERDPRWLDWLVQCTSPYHFYDKLQSTACTAIWSLPRFLWNEIHRAKVWNVSHSFARLYFISFSFLFHSYPAFYFIIFPTLFHSHFIFTQPFISLSAQDNIFGISLLFHCLPRATSLVFHCCFIVCLGQYHWYFMLFHCLPRAISLVFHCCFIACLKPYHWYFIAVSLPA